MCVCRLLAARYGALVLELLAATPDGHLLVASGDEQLLPLHIALTHCAQVKKRRKKKRLLPAPRKGLWFNFRRAFVAALRSVAQSCSLSPAFALNTKSDHKVHGGQALLLELIRRCPHAASVLTGSGDAPVHIALRTKCPPRVIEVRGSLLVQS